MMTASRSVRRGLDAVQEDAAAAGIYSGVMRELLAKYGFN
jgi:hypothetical protein